jgi:exodeoxyribonuclease VII small subunit
MSKSKKDQQSYEASIERLDEIIGKLDSGEVTLDEALTLYEEGVGLVKACAEKLQAAEVRLKKLEKDVNGSLKVVEGEPPEE